MNDQPTADNGRENHNPYEYNAPPQNFPQQQPFPPQQNFQPQQPWGFQPPDAWPSPTQLRVGQALSYGWKKFVANIGVWLAFMAIIGVAIAAFYVVVIVAIIVVAATGTNSVSETSFDVGFTVVTVVVTTVAATVGYFVSAILTRGALLEVDGARPSFGAFFRLSGVANILAVAVVISILDAVANAANSYFGIVVGIVIGVATWCVLQFLLDRSMSAVDAVAASAKVYASNFVPMSLLLLALLGINIVAAIPCGLGLIFTVPVSVIATTYAYRVLTGGPVSPPA